MTVNWKVLTDLEWQIEKLGQVDTAALPKKATWTDPDPPAPAPNWQEASEDFALQAPDNNPSPPASAPAPGWKASSQRFVEMAEASPASPAPASPEGATWQDGNKIFMKNYKMEE